MYDDIDIFYIHHIYAMFDILWMEEILHQLIDGLSHYL
jgi:cytochrome c oxidase assembly factor CtaG